MLDFVGFFLTSLQLCVTSCSLLCDILLLKLKLQPVYLTDAVECNSCSLKRCWVAWSFSKAVRRWTVLCPTKRCLDYSVHPINIYQWGEELGRRPTSDIFMRASLESLKVAEIDRDFGIQWVVNKGSRSSRSQLIETLNLRRLDSFQFVEDVDTNPERSWQEFKLVSEMSPVA